MDVSNGEGVGISLFVQGCPFHCKGCFNQETWDFSGGTEWNEEINKKFMILADRPYIKRISILGGEPLADQNVVGVYDIVNELKARFPDKKIWLYSGYEYEDIFNKPITSYEDMYRRFVVNTVDIMCAGRFVYEKQDVNHKAIKWVGSTNQRVIDTKKSILNNQNATLYGA